MVINPNPPAISARLAPGRGPAPMGRRLLDRSGQSVTVSTASGSVTIRSDNPPIYQNRRQHKFSQVVANNLPGAR